MIAIIQSKGFGAIMLGYSLCIVYRFFVNLTTQTSQTDKFWLVSDKTTTRKILCVCIDRI